MVPAVQFFTEGERSGSSARMRTSGTGRIAERPQWDAPPLTGDSVGWREWTTRLRCAPRTASLSCGACSRSPGSPRRMLAQLPLATPYDDFAL